MSTFINSPSLDQLKKEYDTIAQKANNYKRANMIWNYPADADITYLKLVRSKFLAFIAYKKAEVGESRFNKLFAPMYNKKLADVEELLRERGVMV
nr:hypothetical protein [uncultured Methanobrevibacter sp.]